MSKQFLYEFDFDIALSKLGFKDKTNFSFHETKLFLLYTIGKKFKKEEIIKQVKSIRGTNDDVLFIKKDEIKLLQELNENMITDLNNFQSLCNFITNNDKYMEEVFLEKFNEKIKEILPNLSDEQIKQIFYYLSNNNRTINVRELRNSKLK